MENIDPFHMALRLELEIPSLGLRKAVILQSMVFGLSHLWSWKPMVAASPLDSNGCLAAEKQGWIQYGIPLADKHGDPHIRNPEPLQLGFSKFF